MIKENKTLSNIIIRNILCVLLSIYVALWPLSSFAQTATLLPNGMQQFFDNDGNPLTSGTVDFYIPNTSTRKNTWKDAAETILNTNPVVLDAAGRALILGDGSYRQVLKDRLGNLIWDKPVVSFNSGGTIITTGDGDLVGTVKPWAGFLAPNQYAFAYGQEISRTTYSALLTAITQTSTVICTSTSNIITGLADTTQIPIGAKVELTCVPPGTTITAKTGSSITLSNPSNVSLNAAAVFFPYGDGNGTTTFNLPDLRGYVVGGRDNMGGSVASRLPTTYDAIGASGGNQSLTLSLANLPSFAPALTLTDPGHTHTLNNASSVWTSTVSLTAGGSGSVFAGTQAITANTATTGITASVNHIGGGGAATSAIKVAVGSGYTNGAQVLTVAGGTCSVQPTVNVTIAGNVVSTVNSIATAGNCSVPPVNPASTTGGGGTGATLDVSYTVQSVSLLQPTLALNYIIKITPDSSAQQASGVSSLGGQIGAIGCSTGILCTGNNIAIDPALFGAGLTLSGGIVTTSSGVLNNTPIEVTSDPTINNNSFCGETIYASGAAYYNITISAAATFNSPCTMRVVNTDTVRGKTVVVTGGTNCYLSAGQAAVITKALTALISACPNPAIVTNLTLFIDKDTGNDANDCLAATTGACQTSAQAKSNLINRYINNGQVKIKWGCTTPPCTYNNLGFSMGPTSGYSGTGFVILEGDTTTPDNVVMSTTNASEPFAIAAGRYWIIQGFKTTSTFATVNALDITGPNVRVDFNSMDFGSLNAGTHVSANIQTIINSNGNYTISGGGAAFNQCVDQSNCHFTNGVGTLTGTPAFSIGLIVSHGLAVLGTTSTNFSGPATGTSCVADFGGIIDVAGGIASLPGTGTCNVDTAGVAK